MPPSRPPGWPAAFTGSHISLRGWTGIAAAAAAARRANMPAGRRTQHRYAPKRCSSFPRVARASLSPTALRLPPKRRALKQCSLPWSCRIYAPAAAVCPLRRQRLRPPCQQPSLPVWRHCAPQPWPARGRRTPGSTPPGPGSAGRPARSGSQRAQSSEHRSNGPPSAAFFFLSIDGCKSVRSGLIYQSIKRRKAPHRVSAFPSCCLRTLCSTLSTQHDPALRPVAPAATHCCSQR